MSSQAINLSPDLLGLKTDGFEIDIRYGHLIVTNIPYVNAKREVKRGTLVSTLTLAGDKALAPDTHVIMFAGEYPCDMHGVPIEQIRHGDQTQTIGADLTVNYEFSNKPAGGYLDYRIKIETYANIISGPAEALDPSVTARTFRVIEPNPEDSVFNYIENASGRAGISAATRKLEINKVAIVGVGGSGGYVLDFVAKTPVREIHIFDGDKFLTHNAFRTPGAPSLAELREVPTKVSYLAECYSKMRRNIFQHPYYIDPANVSELRDMDFVFLCMDGNKAKADIVKSLEEFNLSFADVGIGLIVVNGAICGVVRTTTSTPQKRDHVHQEHRIPFTDAADNEYSTNIQIAELNALNAASVVIRWKRLLGFYHDFEHEHHSVYTVDGNHLANDDQTA